MKLAKKIRNLCLGLSLFTSSWAVEEDFVERLALSDDKPKVLSELVKGTRDYNYYWCLYYQSIGEYEKAKPFAKEFYECDPGHEIDHRQAMYLWDMMPDKVVSYLKRNLNPSLSHQRDRLPGEVVLPVEFDNSKISIKRILDQFGGKYYSNLKDNAIDSYLTHYSNKMDEDYFLKKIRRADNNKVVSILAKELNKKNRHNNYYYQYSSFEICKKLTIKQMEELIRLVPRVLNDDMFIAQYLKLLKPDSWKDFENDTIEYREWLEREWAFVNRLSVAHTPLKVQVMYRYLDFDRRQGIWNKERFETYLKLPKSSNRNRKKWTSSYSKTIRECKTQSLRIYMNQVLEVNNYQRNETVIRQQIFSSQVDDLLVRDYLMHFYKSEENFSYSNLPFIKYFDNYYAKLAFCESKLLNGIGEREKWEEQLKEDRDTNNHNRGVNDLLKIKNRKELYFNIQNNKIFLPKDNLALALEMKNIKKAIVKIYDINTEQYYRQFAKEIGGELDLNGLKANHEIVINNDEHPMRRMKKQIVLPEHMQKRGVYLVEVIGEDKSCRALISCGRYFMQEEITAAGHALRFVDENGRTLSNATAYIAGHKLSVDDDGFVMVPFTHKPESSNVVITYDGFSSLAKFQHKKESYSLSNEVFVNREELIAGKKANIRLRPILKCNGYNTETKLLKNIIFKVISTDFKGIDSVKTFKNMDFEKDLAKAISYIVPENTKNIKMILTADIKNISTGKDDNLSTQQSYSINQIKSGSQITDIYMLKEKGKYLIEVRGRNGELIKDMPVRVKLQHYFVEVGRFVESDLQTDENGRVNLGALSGITKIIVSSSNMQTRNWRIGSDRQEYLSEMHIEEGGVLQLPIASVIKKLSLGQPISSNVFDVISLHKVKNGLNIKNMLEHASVNSNATELVIQDLPEGDYELIFKEDARKIKIKAGAGNVSVNGTWNRHRALELSNTVLPAIEYINITDESVIVKCKNLNEDVRLHIQSARYLQQWKMIDFTYNTRVELPQSQYPRLSLSSYQDARKVGEEFSYILRRQYTKKYPGNMLAHPELLLNPWALSDTSTRHKGAKEGESYGSFEGRSGGGRRRAVGRYGGSRGVVGNYSPQTIDYTNNKAVSLYDLKPSEGMVFKIKKEVFEGMSNLSFCLESPENISVRSIDFGAAKIEKRERRFASVNDSENKVTKQRVTILRKGQKQELLGSMEGKIFGSIADVFSVLKTIHSDSKLNTFSFITSWNKKTAKEKEELYRKYACHELHVFLYFKDKEFFTAKIKPFLISKKNKTFMDEWLLDSDMKKWQSGIKFKKLNAAERALLACRVKDEQKSLLREMNEHLELNPVNEAKWKKAFAHALQINDVGNMQVAKQEVSRISGMGYNSPSTMSPMPMAEECKEDAFSDAECDSIDGFSIAKDKNLAKPAFAPMKANKKLYNSKKKNRMAKARKRQSINFYRPIDKTKEWAENNYYNLPIESQNANLIKVNRYWQTLAAKGNTSSFLSEYILETGNSFSEIMLALAVLDLPLSAEEHKNEVKDNSVEVTAGSNLLLIHKDLSEIQNNDADMKPLLIRQLIVDPKDSYTKENGLKKIKTVSSYESRRVYECRIIASNATPNEQKAEVFIRIPNGAIALNGEKSSDSKTIVSLAPYRTWNHTYYFYFPSAGTFKHHAPRAWNSNKDIGSGKDNTIKVNPFSNQLDTKSWYYISQFGTEKDVLSYLQENNLREIKLNLIAWRMRDKGFYSKIMLLLENNHIYKNTLFAYSLTHKDTRNLSTWLSNQTYFVRKCGVYLDSKLLTIDPIERNTYQHLTYSPLVNARAHTLGGKNKILNNKFNAQYKRLIKILSYKKDLSDEDKLEISSYLFLQSRIEEALKFVDEINPSNIEEKIQYDYLQCYANFYKENVDEAERIAKKYENYETKHWREKFLNVLSQCNEIKDVVKEAGVSDEHASHEQKQNQNAETAVSLDMRVEDKQIIINSRNAKTCNLSYYLMDIEQLFSRNPFVRNTGKSFALIKPNLTYDINLKEEGGELRHKLPENMKTENLVVEAKAEGIRTSQTYFANNLLVSIVENQGQLRLRKASDNKRLSKTYVKVYAKMKNGAVKFYKDGYTDLRGYFDYTSLNTNDLDNVSEFSILVNSLAEGAIIKECKPPKR